MYKWVIKIIIHQKGTIFHVFCPSTRKVLIAYFTPDWSSLAPGPSSGFLSLLSPLSPFLPGGFPRGPFLEGADELRAPLPPRDPAAPAPENTEVEHYSYKYMAFKLGSTHIYPFEIGEMLTSAKIGFTNRDATK